MLRLSLSLLACLALTGFAALGLRRRQAFAPARSAETDWARALVAQSEERPFEALSAARALVKADERSPASWRLLAWTMAFYLAPSLERVDERWAWTAAAIDALEQGRARCPADEAWRLDLDLAWLYERGLKGELAQRFREDGRRNPGGRSPIVMAVAAAERAAEGRDDVAVGFRLLGVLLEALRRLKPEAAERAGLEARAETALANLSARLPAGSEGHVRWADFEREIRRLLRARGESE